MLRPRGLRASAVAAAGLAALGSVMLSASPARADPIGVQAYGSEQWVRSTLHLPAAWTKTRGAGVIVAVIDSGVNPSVPDLAGSVITGPDYSGVSTPSSNPNWGVHGTWMASLVAGHAHGPGDGILGSAPASRVLSIRVITDSTDPNFSRYQNESASRGQDELAEAITYAVAHRAGVISLSLGYSLQSLQVRQALQDAYDHNVVVVASAGNSGDAAEVAGTRSAPPSFPANYPGVLAVAAVTSTGQVASFSSENQSVLVGAPGKSVPAQGREGGYWYVDGTSPACALVAGVAALIESRYRGISPALVTQALTTTAHNGPSGRYNERTGFGTVDAAAALRAAGKLTGVRPAASQVSPSAHFGGGPAAVPPPPVAPRGIGQLVLCAVFAAVSLALALAAGLRLRVLRRERNARGYGAAAYAAPGYPPARPPGYPPGSGHTVPGADYGVPDDPA